jgi:hypothetical protein
MSERKRTQYVAERAVIFSGREFAKGEPITAPLDLLDAQRGYVTVKDDGREWRQYRGGGELFRRGEDGSIWSKVVGSPEQRRIAAPIPGDRELEALAAAGVVRKGKR